MYNYTFTYSFFTVCTEFHVARTQTKFPSSCTYYTTVSARLEHLWCLHDKQLEGLYRSSRSDSASSWW